MKSNLHSSALEIYTISTSVLTIRHQKYNHGYRTKEFISQPGSSVEHFIVNYIERGHRFHLKHIPTKYHFRKMKYETMETQVCAQQQTHLQARLAGRAPITTAG